MHPHHQNILVVRTIKDHDLALARRAQMRTPDKIVSSLLFARLLESKHERSLRVHSAEYVPNDPVLTGGIKSLQHNEKGLAAIRVKQVLQLVQALDVLLNLGQSGLMRLVFARVRGINF